MFRHKRLTTEIPQILAEKLVQDGHVSADAFLDNIANAEVLEELIEYYLLGDGRTSGVPSMCSSMPTCQPSIALRHASAVRAGERGLQHGRRLLCTLPLLGKMVAACRLCGLSFSCFVQCLLPQKQYNVAPVVHAALQSTADARE